MPVSDKSQYCMACKNWKPERTHHCSICETCVLKMDHHCPWLGNCVGYHNFKEFFLFCFYQAVIGMIYSYCLFPYAFFRPEEDTYELSTFGYVNYYLTNCLALPISYALIFLTLNVLLQLYNNISSLERMSMRTFKLPCIGPIGEGHTIPNEYDMLWLSNFKQVLGSRLWMWPLPITEEMKGQGFYYPKIPEISMSDLNIMLKDTSRAHNTSFNVNEFDHDPKEYIKKAMKKYGGRVFTIPPGPEGG
jgi:DHHC palmitoyltransferase